jgi:methionine sulfoxide reductase catalytic subunit
MRKPRPPLTPRPSEITPADRYYNRREFIASLAAAGVVGSLAPDTVRAAPLQHQKNARMSLKERPNSFEDITTYNNFYEFGTEKADPAQRAGKFQPRPWSVTVSGEAEVRGTFTLEDRALEIRVQGHQIDRRDPVHRKATADELE